MFCFFGKFWYSWVLKNGTSQKALPSYLAMCSKRQFGYRAWTEHSEILKFSYINLIFLWFYGCSFTSFKRHRIAFLASLNMHVSYKNRKSNRKEEKKNLIPMLLKTAAIQGDCLLMKGSKNKCCFRWLERWVGSERSRERKTITRIFCMKKVLFWK